MSSSFIFNNINNVSITDLSSDEIELWIYKANNIYQSKKFDKIILEKIFNASESILKDRCDDLNEENKGILLSLHDNIKYDLKN